MFMCVLVVWVHATYPPLFGCQIPSATRPIITPAHLFVSETDGVGIDVIVKAFRENNSVAAEHEMRLHMSLSDIPGVLPALGIMNVKKLYAQAFDSLHRFSDLYQFALVMKRVTPLKEAMLPVGGTRRLDMAVSLCEVCVCTCECVCVCVRVGLVTCVWG